MRETLGPNKMPSKDKTSLHKGTSGMYIFLCVIYFLVINKEPEVNL